MIDNDIHTTENINDIVEDLETYIIDYTDAEIKFSKQEEILLLQEIIAKLIDLVETLKKEN